MHRLLADRTSRLYLIGTTASSIGDNALWLTVLIWVKVLTGSTSQAGLSIFMLTLGVLTGPVTGLLVDRVRRRPLVDYRLILLSMAALLIAATGYLGSRREQRRPLAVVAEPG